jgi:hypothetical protein
MAKTIDTAVNVVTSQSLAATGTVRGTADVRTKDGGRLTLKITNGGTGPTAQCEGRVLISHSDGATPTAASAGVDWKTVFRFGGGTTASTVTEQSWVFGPDVRHIEVEFTGNTAQAVTVEAVLSTFTYT